MKQTELRDILESYFAERGVKNLEKDRALDICISQSLSQIEGLQIWATERNGMFVGLKK